MSTPGDGVHASLERLQGVCRHHGFRLTHQRLEILRALTGKPGHPTVEEVYGRVRPRLPTISMDTVYRALAAFERMGLIARVQPGGPAVRYDADPTSHHHLICRRCREIRDFRWPEFDRMSPPIESGAWGSVEGRRVEIWGLCPRCAAEAGNSPQAPCP